MQAALFYHAFIAHNLPCERNKSRLGETRATA